MDSRIQQLDVLRGIAVLGILVMNIKGFALIGALYINPMAIGSLTFSQWCLFVIERLFVDYKFLGLFSLLFGAGIALLDAKLRNGPLNAFAYQIRRLLVLAVIGACHAFILWYGDILLSYAACGLVALLFVRLPVKALFVLAFIFACVPLWFFAKGQLSMAEASDETIRSMVGGFWVPAASSIAADIASYTGTLGQQFEARLSSLRFMLLHLFPRENFWKSTSLMLLGIGLFKAGFFSGNWKSTAYLKWGMLLLVIGLCITAGGMVNDIKQGFAIQTSLYLGRSLLYLGSIPQAIGYAALFYYFFSRVKWLQNSGLAAVGRLALTNYVSQTLICTFIFYGWGLGLFAQFDVLTLLLFVVAIWIFQCVFSRWWLGRHQMGPLEWGWRSLTKLGYTQ